jgi:hypothetical protein
MPNGEWCIVYRADDKKMRYNNDKVTTQAHWRNQVFDWVKTVSLGENLVSG